MLLVNTFLIQVSLCSLVENSLPLPCLAYNSVLRCSQALSLQVYDGHTTSNETLTSPSVTLLFCILHLLILG